MLEIYNEELKDSLEPRLVGEKKNKKLDIHGSTEKGFYVKGLKKFNVKTIKELKEKLECGKSTRKVRATAMNDYSSRSHSIFTIIIESSVTDENGNQSFKIGKLNMVDLAGSEKQKQTQTTDEGLKEGININLSLSNLVNVINLLVKGSSHIPYRNSKLTKLLADSLGGNSKTLMIANIGPSDSNYSETLQTLKYANRAKQIKNKPKINEDSKDALLRQKQDELKLLKLQIQRMGLHSNELSKNIDSLNLSYLKIENSASKKKKNKENFIDYKEKMEELKNEDQTIKREKNILQRKLEEQRNKLVNEEKEKKKLIEKYNNMCNNIISKHDYEKDVRDAEKELDKLKKDKTYQKKFLQAKELLQNKKEEVNKINQNTKKVQEIINKISSQIIFYREKINQIKQNQNSIKQTMSSKIKSLISKIENNRMILKKQLFFLQNLIPKNFVNLIENTDQKNLKAFHKKAYSMNNLKKPISLNYYDLYSSYKNPFLREIGMKKKKLDYPNDDEVYDDDCTDESVVESGVLNLKFFTGNDNKIYDAKSYVEEKFE